jgi:HD superfamily phosphohydrolase
MMSDYKIIHDTVHGSIKFEGVFLDLLNAIELQRLHDIKQLGLANLVFPGANHTRLEHSIGTYHVVNKIANSLKLNDEEKNLVASAGLLHDVGHAPYSHTLEYVLYDKLGIEHTEVTKDIIMGNFDILSPIEKDLFLNKKNIPQILEEHGIRAKEIADLVTKEIKGMATIEQFTAEKRELENKNYLNQLIHGVVDADQMDYLLRDAHYTGVAHGIIDIERLIQTMEIFNGNLVVHKRGVTAIEGLLVARGLMYSSVYFHKTVRIAELMLTKAVEPLNKDDIENVHRMTDSELITKLMQMDGFQREIATMLKYRQLFKNAYSLDVNRMDEEKLKIITELSDYKKRKAKEEEISRKLNIPVEYVIVDVPEKELLLSEPRINKTEVLILDNQRLKPLSKYSPLARALQIRTVHQWGVMVSTIPKYRDKVNRIAEKVLFE